MPTIRVSLVSLSWLELFPCWVWSQVQVLSCEQKETKTVFIVADMCTINWQITGRLIRRLAVRSRSHGENKKYEVLEATYGSFVVYNTK